MGWWTSRWPSVSFRPVRAVGQGAAQLGGGGLLVPAAVDPWTGYRYYAPGQLPEAGLIRLLHQACRGGAAGGDGGRDGPGPGYPAAAWDQCFPLRKSIVKVLATEDMTAWLAVISPSSRFWLSEVLERFSDPMNTFACRVP